MLHIEDLSRAGTLGNETIREKCERIPLGKPTKRKSSTTTGAPNPTLLPRGWE